MNDGRGDGSKLCPVNWDLWVRADSRGGLLSEKNSGQEHAKDGEATRFLEASAHMIASGLRLLGAA
jgi:hypothetical protein